jgi:ADP-heptose:LPS heptosyltransferase
MASGGFPILFITATRIGDAVLSSGLIKRLADEIPHARFTIVAGPLAAPLFRDTPGLERLIPLPKEKFGLHWLTLWSAVRGRRWGLVVDMRGSGLAKFLSARKRAVRRPPPAALGPMHKVLEAARVLRVEDDPPPPYLFTGPDTEAAAHALLGGGEGPILALAPAANWVGKTWPPERFAVLAAELTGPNGPMPGGRVLLLGGADDRWAAEVVRRSVSRDRLIDSVGRIELLTAYAALKRVRLFVGNDSGLMHLAAAAGAPTVGLFGPSDDRLYGPWGPNGRMVRGPREFAEFEAIDPELSQQVCHMQDLSVAYVLSEARALFDETALAFEVEPWFPGDVGDDRDL